MQFLYRDASFSFGNKAVVLLCRCWFTVYQKFFACSWHFSCGSSGKELPWWSLRFDSPLADDSGDEPLWGIMQGSKLSEHFGRVEELCCLWEGRGSLVEGSLPRTEVVSVGANKACSEYYKCFPKPK